MRTIYELIQIWRRLNRHPLCRRRPLPTIGKFLWWQIYSRTISTAAIVPFIGTTQLILRRDLSSATGHFYTSLNDFEFTAFLLHFLRADDLFVDVGANVGVYSILASGVCAAKSIAIEPVPDTFSHLKALIELNRLENKISPLNFGVGQSAGSLPFTCSKGQQNHVATTMEEHISVPIITLNDLLKDQSPVLIKIDVEGFELPVLKGANRLLEANAKTAIIIEMMNLGAKYGYSDDQVDHMLRDWGLSPYQYFPFERRLKKLERYRRLSNNIYLRELNWVSDRLINGAPFKVAEDLI
jgi:FkbM family methyltransferase